MSILKHHGDTKMSNELNKEPCHEHDEDCGCHDDKECIVVGHNHFHIEFDKTEVGCVEMYREFRPITEQPQPNVWNEVVLDTVRLNCIPGKATTNVDDNSITLKSGGCYNIYYDAGEKFYQSVNVRVDLRLTDNGVPIPGTEITTFCLAGVLGALQFGSDICYKVPRGTTSKIKMESRTSADTFIQTDARARIKITRTEDGLKCPSDRRH